MEQTQLPLFVYGTLMSGERAYGRLSHAVDRYSPATLAGTVLYSLGHYPMAVPGNGVVVGELHWIVPAMHDQLLAQLDEYEGVGFGYSREQATVNLSDRAVEDALPVQAWVYYGLTHIAVQHPQIISGDWRFHQRGGGV